MNFCSERERKELPDVRSFLPVIDSVDRIGQNDLLTATVACGSTWVYELVLSRGCKPLV